jgi:hypothetical protein
LSSWRMDSRACIARRSYWRRPETTYRRSMRYLTLSETGHSLRYAICARTPAGTPLPGAGGVCVDQRLDEGR